MLVYPYCEHVFDENLTLLFPIHDNIFSDLNWTRTIYWNHSCSNLSGNSSSSPQSHSKIIRTHQCKMKQSDNTGLKEKMIDTIVAYFLYLDTQKEG